MGWLVLAAVIGVLLYKIWQTQQNYLSWPTLEEYWRQHPDCRTEIGTKCKKCKSPQLQQVPFANVRDSRRVCRCTQCNTVLYRLS